MNLTDLLEERRYRQFITDIAAKYKDRDDVFVHFAPINKIGINPKSTHNTPMGVYAYPMTYAWKRFVSVGDLNFPYASKRKYVFFIQATSPVTEISEYSNKDWVQDRMKLKRMFGDQTFSLNLETSDWYNFSVHASQRGYDPDDYDNKNLTFDQLMEIARVTRVPKSGPAKFFTKMWNLTRLIAMDGKEFPNTTQWNRILYKMGHHIISDKKGTGSIHFNEQFQALFLTVRDFKVIDSFQQQQKRV